MKPRPRKLGVASYFYVLSSLFHAAIASLQSFAQYSTASSIPGFESALYLNRKRVAAHGRLLATKYLPALAL